MATEKIMAMIRALNFQALNIFTKYTILDLSAQLYNANCGSARHQLIHDGKVS
jgi:hypothetical protein